MSRLADPRVRRAALVGLLVAAVVATAVLAAPRPTEGLPLSPHSAAPGGTKALTQILERLGADVVVAATPPEDAAAALLLVDNIDEASRDAWLAVAERGGTLVVADPGSQLAPGIVGDTGFGFLDPSIGRDCDVAALAGASRVQPGGGLTFDVPDGAVGCYPRGEGRWLVARPEGEGTLVTVGGARFLTNEQIGEADNAVLAAALLAPTSGEVVAIAPPDLAAADAEAGLTALLPDAAVLLMLQLLVAFVALVWWRSRRLGAPVIEPPAVALPGSELVMGVGSLYQQTGAARHAAGLLRDEALRRVAARLRMGPGPTAEAAVDAAVAAGVERRLAQAALLDPITDDERALVALAGTVERLRAALDRVDENEHEGAARV